MAEDREDPETPDIVGKATRMYRDSRDHTSEWREEVKDNYDMVANRQWAATDLAAMNEQQRPAVTFDRIARAINAIVGTQVSNRQETRFIPREQGDVTVNEVLTAGADWVRDESNAEDEETDAFEDMCITGMGWTETRLDYEQDPDGKVLIERVDPLEMYWDPGATKRNLSDRRWNMRVRSFPVDEFEARWPDADIDAAASPWEEIDEISARTHVYPQDAYKDQQSKSGKGRRMIRVAHLQWCEKKAAYRVGRDAERLDAEKFAKLKDKLDESGTKYVRQQQVIWREAFVAGNVVLEDGECPYPDGPTFRAMTYKRDRNENQWFGLVRAMKDPQKFGNKFFSQILDILNKSAKGGLMVEADATDDLPGLESTWARPDAVHVFNSGALTGGKVKEKMPPPYPQGLDRLMTFSLDAVHEVTGINLELLGFANRQQAGVLEQQRKQSGITILQPLFDALRRYRKEQGRVLLHFIQEYLTDGRLIRINGKNGSEQYVPLAKQMDTAKYDVIVDEAPTSPNMKEKTFGALVEMMPSMAKMGMPLPPELLDYAPIPSSLAQKWKQLIEKQSGMDPAHVQEQVAQFQAEIQKLQQENAALKDKKAESVANFEMKAKEQQTTAELKAREQEANAVIEAQKLHAQLQIADEQHQAKIIQMQQEYELKVQQMERDFELKNREMEMNNDIERRRINHEVFVSKRQAKAKAIADGLPYEDDGEPDENYSSALAKTVVETQAPIADALMAINQTVVAVAQQLSLVSQQMTAPRKIVNGPDGRPRGVQVEGGPFMSLVSENGRIVGTRPDNLIQGIE